jgi:hypothetical protein
MGWYSLNDGEEQMVVAVILPGLFLTYEEAEDAEVPEGTVFTAPNGQLLIKVGQGDYRPYHF